MRTRTKLAQPTAEQVFIARIADARELVERISEHLEDHLGVDPGSHLRSNGISMPKGSLTVQLAFGRERETWERRGSPAPISAAQIEALRAAAAGPEAAA